MTLIERLLQPLLKAQHQKGVQEGIQRGKKRSGEAYQEWIRQQAEAGAQFRDDIPPPQP